jgi:hypothetical protein
LLKLYVAVRQVTESLSNLSAALIGAVIGGLLIFFGANFHLGSWFADGTTAYALAILWGAMTALAIRYLLRRE